ncbi:DNA methyltransferase, partial [candidate division WOR-3 bacterium]|nr:DNA methyltransferase [candidate division WOR-3 bacterium]
SLIKKAAQKRVFGFEILPAPFVVSHLQLGLKLGSLGVPLGDDERVGVYLTNTLTGWEIKKQPPLEWKELQAERESSGKVKNKDPILVILGNPPYNAFAGVSPEEEEGLVEVYKGIYFETKKDKKGRPIQRKDGSIIQDRRYKLNNPPEMGGWGIKKFNLDDFYIRFFRIAERRIVEKTKKGIVCFISNFSYLGDPSFVVMRERFLSEFDKLWFDCMNGDSRETGKRTPEGKPDPSVFSTKQSPVGIRVGTTIGLLARKEQGDKKPTVRFRHFWGVTKKENLEATLKEEDEDKFNGQYEIAHPDKSNRYSFRPGAENPYYEEWPKLLDLSTESPYVGLEECRGGGLIDIDKAELEERMKAYYDSDVDWESIKTINPRLTEDASGFDAQKARSKIQKEEEFTSDNLFPYTVRPFDVRWCYHSLVAPLWNRPRPTLKRQCWESNFFIVSRFHCQATPEGIPMYISTGLFDKQTISRNPGAIPIRIKPQPKKSAREQAGQINMHEEEVEIKPIANLSDKAREYLKSLGITNPDADVETAGLIWMHALAIGYSPAYLTENADGIRQDWPRIPLPASKDLLEKSASLGRKVAKLLDTEQEVKTVTSGSIRPELKVIGVIKHVEGKNLNPDKGHLEITASWGHPGKGGVTMPGKGKLTEREYTEEERQAIMEGAKALGISEEEAFNRLGETTFDIYLNDVAYWRNVPRDVWEYYIGGYQVIKKWLSYREKRMLGRGISIDEAVEVRDMARRLVAIILLEPKLDANYRKVKEKTFKWANET